MTKQLSDKIKLLSFLCTFLVVWRHSTNMVAFYGGYVGVPEWLSYIEWSLSRITDIAVPIFFLISGYFFFRSDYCNWYMYKEMIAKKGRTLLIPFVFWNLFGFVFLLAGGAINIPTSFREFVTDLLLSSYDGSLWYVRNLMLMMAVVPFYGFMFHKRWGTFFIIPVVIILLWVWWPVDCRIISLEGWLFFLLGGVLQRYVPSLRLPFGNYMSAIVGLVWLILCFCYQYGGVLMAKSTIVLGIVAFWSICDYVPKKWMQKWLYYAKYSFFIYVTHIFVMKTLKVGIAHFFYNDEIAAIVCYITIPIVCFILLLKIGMVFNKYLPNVFLFLTGNRG